MSKTICKDQEILNFGDSDPSTFEVCIFLVNVMGNMYQQWADAGKPSIFLWGTGKETQPSDVCPITNTQFNVDDYNFGSLIWSTFKLGTKEITEPFGCIVKSKDGSIYLVFRGSKSLEDFLVDAQKSAMEYIAPTENPPTDVIQVEKGWYKVYCGLLDALRSQLALVANTDRQITITGHSLGSALATLAVPEAVAHSLQVRMYNSASPMVGLQSFADYYNSLGVEETFRLVNKADTVPNVPNNLLPKNIPLYIPVGNEITFSSDYGKEPKTHDPCCSYAYAIFNPDNPCNQDYDGCNQD